LASDGNENVYTGYGEYSARFGKFGVLAGVRAESTHAACQHVVVDLPMAQIFFFISRLWHRAAGTRLVPNVVRIESTLQSTGRTKLGARWARLTALPAYIPVAILRLVSFAARMNRAVITVSRMNLWVKARSRSSAQ